jgi:hypothetical protein
VIASILPPGAKVGPLEMAPNGQYRVWLPRAVVDRRARMRPPSGELQRRHSQAGVGELRARAMCVPGSLAAPLD